MALRRFGFESIDGLVLFFSRLSFCFQPYYGMKLWKKWNKYLIRLNCVTVWCISTASILWKYDLLAWHCEFFFLFLDERTSTHVLINIEYFMNHDVYVIFNNQNVAKFGQSAHIIQTPWRSVNSFIFERLESSISFDGSKIWTLEKLVDLFVHFIRKTDWHQSKKKKKKISHARIDRSFDEIYSGIKVKANINDVKWTTNPSRQISIFR